jgi:fatty-acyl-CoA synthase
VGEARDVDEEHQMDDIDRYLPPWTADLARARSQTIGTLLARTALKYGAKLAVVHRDTRRTFAELDADANRVANALAERGVVRNQRVAIYSHNSYAFVVAYFALARLGAISVPVNFNFVASEVRYLLEDSGSTAAIVEDALVDTLGAAQVALSLGVVIGHRPGWTSFDRLLEHDDATAPDVEIGDDDPVQLLYTSGTTSAPKGAIMTNRNLIAQYVSDIVDGEYHRDDVELHALPLYHCAALHDFLTPDVYLGATSVIVDAADPELILRTVEAEGITKMFCPPTVWIRLLRSPSFDRHDLSSLRKGYYGAAIMPVAVLEELGRRLPGVRLFNYYGQTELAPNATVLFPEEQIAKAGTAGRPSLNVETRLHDEDDRPVPVGQVGEIVHRTPHVMRGYWGKPDATAEVFRHGWFHSGDLGVMDADGYLTIVDRKKDIIITGGENVASREVEDAIYSHPAVSEVAVFGVKHPEWIEAVAAAVVLRDGETVTGTEIVAHARERLAGFKSPKYVVLVEELPKNPSGKILKRELRDTYAGLADAGAP